MISFKMPLGCCDQIVVANIKMDIKSIRAVMKMSKNPVDIDDSKKNIAAMRRVLKYYGGEMNWLKRLFQGVRGFFRPSKLKNGVVVKHFKTTNKFLERTLYFSELDAPDWLTSVNTIPGSTMDNRWFYRVHVLKLKVGGVIETDFSVITRVS